MKKVQVLLSSYNGEAYIEQQLDSIFSQKGVEVECLVRDDGSTDLTKEILTKYKKKNSKLSVIFGENVGYSYSFMELIRKSGCFDYFSFADQDDVWCEEKLLRAIEKIELENNEVGTMYCSNCKVVDAQLKYIKKLHTKDNMLPDSIERALLQGFAHGCTMVLNLKARNIVKSYKPEYNYAHDFWIPIVLFYTGKVVYDSNAYILYRQHSSNVLGSKQSIAKIAKVNFKRIKNGISYSNLAAELLKGFDKLLPLESKEFLVDVKEYKQSIFKFLKVLLNKNIRKNTMKGTLFLKVSIIFLYF